MRRTLRTAPNHLIFPALACGLLLVVLAAVPCSAQERGAWQFGLDSGISESRFDSGADFTLFPRFSYYATDRLRLDGFVGLSWVDSSGLASVEIEPGARYSFYRSPSRRWSLNFGGSLGIEVYDDTPEYRGVPAGTGSGTTAATGAAHTPGTLVTLDQDDHLFSMRLVPVELELWRSGRSSWSLGVDWRSDVFDGGELGNERTGVFVGYRVRLD